MPRPVCFDGTGESLKVDQARIGKRLLVEISQALFVVGKVLLDVSR